MGIWASRNNIRKSSRNHHVGKFDIDLEREIKKIVIANSSSGIDDVLGANQVLTTDRGVDGGGNSIVFSNMSEFGILSPALETGFTINGANYDVNIVTLNAAADINILAAGNFTINDSNGSTGLIGQVLKATGAANSTWQYHQDPVVFNMTAVGGDLVVADPVSFVKFVEDYTVTDMVAHVLTAPTGSGITIDVEKNGVSMLSTLLTIDATELSSETAAVPVVISDGDINAGDVIEIKVNAVGSTTPGASAQVIFKGHQP